MSDLNPALFTSARPEDTDPGLIQASHWNRVVGLVNSLIDPAAAHGSLMYRDVSDVTDGVSWVADVAVGSVLVSGGVGAAPSWSATPTLTSLTIGTLQAPSSDGILHHAGTTNANLSGSKLILEYWDKTARAASPNVYWTQTITPTGNFGTRDNCVFQQGWNAAAGGGLIDGTYSGTRDAWEQYYEQATPGIGYWERHISMMPTDVATSGEIRLIEMSGRCDVTRDNVHPAILFQGEYFSFTYPSVAGFAYGDSFRVAIESTHFGASLTLNNGYSYIRRGAPSQGQNYPLLFQQNNAAAYDLRILWFETASDEMHLLGTNNVAACIVHVGQGGVQSRLFVDGKNSANLHGSLVFRDEQGSGTKESFVAQDGSALYLGAPQSALANYNDATLAAGAHLTLTSALATFAGGIKHGSTTLLQTSVGLTNGAAAATGTLTNAPTAGNPTKWIPINDNGTTRYIPAW